MTDATRDVTHGGGSAAGEFLRYRVTGEKERELCPAIFDAVRDKGLRLAELKAETRTLESVFRDLAAKEGVAA